jgi:hypothetical protein
MTALNAVAERAPISSATRRPPKNRRMRTRRDLDARERPTALAEGVALVGIVIDMFTPGGGRR